MKKWAIQAIFTNERGQENHTLYEEKTYFTKRGAIRAIMEITGIYWRKMPRLIAK